ncbi:MAG: hypothetical protein WD768_07540 [Phycisphaeraceae bacterium]
MNEPCSTELQEQVLCEYQALRDEIRLMYERRTQHQSIGWAALAILVGAGGSAGLPELAVMGALFTQVVLLDDMHNYKNMMRVATYIRMFIEPRLPGLSWERVRHTATLEQNKNRQLGFFRALTAPPVAAVILTFCLALSYTVQWWPVECSRAILLIGLWLLFFTGMIACANRYVSVGRCVENFEEAFRKIQG